MFGTTVGSVALFLAIICLDRGEARVRCYLCSTKDNETACLYPESYDVKLVLCDQNALDETRAMARRIDSAYDKIFEVDTHAMARHIDLDCLKVVTKLGNRDYTFRGCQLAEASSTDVCFKMQTVNHDFLKRLHCSRCSSDRCNAATTPLWPSIYCTILGYILTIIMVFA